LELIDQSKNQIHIDLIAAGAS